MTKRLTETTAQMDCAIGSRIRAIRVIRSMSQTELAEVLGITFQQIQKYEKGTNRVAASTLIIICQALRVSPLEILGLEGGGLGNSALADMALRCRDLEARIARAKRMLGGHDDEADASTTIDLVFDSSGPHACAPASPPN
ncbi:helix-turn-helix domain-containing protein [Rhizobium tropici]|uniref:HTH cro/C1-type domain-containing protein n=1 Tax=Rhizobium tropici TaxID=398 RepID=A0A329YND9_RHITR|nr:helix-turn-helix transcriptional regulator [Rhizobium tropici]RAX42600.1 hypothetical protein DQ393_06215 [Rhizobium tropici]